MAFSGATFVILVFGADSVAYFRLCCRLKILEVDRQEPSLAVDGVINE
jgi:hypothetical protein